jgi:triacylglycerol lipase
MKSIFSLDTGTTIYLTGHSLGAALATIIYCYAGTVFPERIKLVTFGCPRIGNQEFTDQIKGDSIRIVNNNDAVAKLPVPFWSYRHYTTKKLLGSEVNFKYSLSEHAIDSYYSSLWFSKYD